MNHLRGKGLLGIMGMVTVDGPTAFYVAVADIAQFPAFTHDMRLGASGFGAKGATVSVYFPRHTLVVWVPP